MNSQQQDDKRINSRSPSSLTLPMEERIELLANVIVEKILEEMAADSIHSSEENWPWITTHHECRMRLRPSVFQQQSKALRVILPKRRENKLNDSLKAVVLKLRNCSCFLSQLVKSNNPCKRRLITARIPLIT